MTIRLTVSREDAGYTQPELAKTIDASKTTVSNYERGAVTPKRQTLMAWALATGVDFHWLETGEAPGSGPDQGGAVTCEKLASAGQRVVTLVSAA